MWYSLCLCSAFSHAFFMLYLLGCDCCEQRFNLHLSLISSNIKKKKKATLSELISFVGGLSAEEVV